MIQVRCPKCSTSLALKQAPAAGKVKCPKCATIIAVGSAAPAAVPQGAAKKPANPAPRAGASGNGEIDFRNIPSSSGPAPSGNFPMPVARKVYDGPIALDPIPKQKTGDDDDDEEEDEVEPSQPSSKRKSKKSKQARTIIGLVVLVLALVAGGGVAYWKFGGGGGGGSEGTVAAP